MLQMMIEHTNWLMIDLNESLRREREVDLFGIIEEFHDRLATQVPFLKNVEFDVLWLQGIDGGACYDTSTIFPYLKHICVRLNSFCSIFGLKNWRLRLQIVQVMKKE